MATLSEAGLREDLQAAMKRRDMSTVYVLRGVLAVAGNLRIQTGRPDLTESELREIIGREAKKRDEAEAFARQAGRADLVEQNAAERSVLARYLPAPLEDGELSNLIRDWLAEGVQGIGPLMARLKERHAGQFDGKRASEIIRRVMANG